MENLIILALTQPERPSLIIFFLNFIPSILINVHLINIPDTQANIEKALYYSLTQSDIRIYFGKDHKENI